MANMTRDPSAVQTKTFQQRNADFARFLASGAAAAASTSLRPPRPLAGLSRSRLATIRGVDRPHPTGASAYILYQNEVRAKYREEHPELSCRELLPEIATAWQNRAGSRQEAKVLRYRG